MYVINDMGLLLQLGRLKILEHILPHCAIAISAIRLSEYSLMRRRAIEESCPGIQKAYSDDQFPIWNVDKRKELSLGDLDSIYLALTNDGTLVLSPKDFALERQAKLSETRYEGVDHFIVRIIKDQRVIQIYNLLKAI